jgi:hypothetical protein
MRAGFGLRELDWPTVGPLGVGLAGCLLFAFAPYRDRYWVSFVAILAFALTPLAVASVRPRLETPVCPLNWALFVFLFQLVIDPLLVCWKGPYPFTLPVLPGAAAINISLLVSVVAWFAFVAGMEIAARRTPGPSRLLGRLEALPLPAVSPNRLALAFGILGVIGVGLAFHSPGALLDYFHQAGGHTATQNVKNGLEQSLSVALRAFLAFAFIVPWCAWVDRRQPGQRLVLRTLGVIVLVAIASSTYSYNRAAAAAPVVVMIAVYGLKVMRLRTTAVLMVALLAIGLLTAARAYRNTDLTISQAITTSHGRQQILDNSDLNHEIQVYTSGPQFLGYLLEGTAYAHNPHYGKTVVSSAMYPVPRLGRPFRSSSGVLIYNRLIYGEAGTVDQVVPFQGELFLDFAWGGVVAGYIVLALLVSRLQLAFERAKTAFAAFAAQYAAIWLAFLIVGSLAVVSQIFINFFWPVIVFAALRSDRPRASPA